VSSGHGLFLEVDGWQSISSYYYPPNDFSPGLAPSPTDRVLPIDSLARCVKQNDQSKLACKSLDRCRTSWADAQLPTATISDDNTKELRS